MPVTGPTVSAGECHLGITSVMHHQVERTHLNVHYLIQSQATHAHIIKRKKKAGSWLHTYMVSYNNGEGGGGIIEAAHAQALPVQNL